MEDAHFEVVKRADILRPSGPTGSAKDASSTPHFFGAASATEKTFRRGDVVRRNREGRFERGGRAVFYGIHVTL